MSVWVTVIQNCCPQVEVPNSRGWHRNCC